MAKKQGLDDIIKGAAKLVGKAAKRGAKKTKKSVPAKTPAKKPPQPPKSVVKKSDPVGEKRAAERMKKVSTEIKLEKLSGSKLRGTSVEARKDALRKEISEAQKKINKMSKPPQPPKRPTGGKPPSVGSKGTGRPETRGGMNTKELDAYLKKQNKNSANYFDDNRGYWREEARKKAKNELKKRGRY